MHRTLIIGDVHGCIAETESLLKKLKFNRDQDSLIFCGDMINKGPDSLAVLQLIEQCGAKAIMGNHERGFLKYLDKEIKHQTPDFQLLKENLGNQLDYWMDWIKNLPYYIEHKDYLVVHAGLSPIHALKNTPNKILTNIRHWDGIGEHLNNPNDPPWYHFYKEDKTVIYGHWALKGLNVRKNTIGLDSGCVYGGQLSAISWPSKEITQVQSNFNYFEFKNSNKP